MSVRIGQPPSPYPSTARIQPAASSSLGTAWDAASSPAARTAPDAGLTTSSGISSPSSARPTSRVDGCPSSHPDGPPPGTSSPAPVVAGLLVSLGLLPVMPSTPSSRLLRDRFPLSATSSRSASLAGTPRRPAWSPRHFASGPGAVSVPRSRTCRSGLPVLVRSSTRGTAPACSHLISGRRPTPRLRHPLGCPLLTGPAGHGPLRRSASGAGVPHGRPCRSAAPDERRADPRSATSTRALTGDPAHAPCRAQRRRELQQQPGAGVEQRQDVGHRKPQPLAWLPGWPK